MSTGDSDEKLEDVSETYGSPAAESAAAAARREQERRIQDQASAVGQDLTDQGVTASGEASQGDLGSMKDQSIDGEHVGTDLQEKYGSPTPPEPEATPEPQQEPGE